MRIRGYTADDGHTMMCDYYLSPGWYSLCGHILSTQPGSCGATFSWWMNESVPESGTEEVMLCLYQDQDSTCIDTMAINVTKCGDNSYVFHLPSLQACPELYCVEPVEDLATEAPLCEDMTKDYCSDAKPIPLLDKRTSTYESESGGTPMCDYYLQPGWYKACEHLLATNPVQCSVFSWYATEALPTSGTGEVNLCMLYNGTCLENKTITVSKCQDGSFAYNLNGTEACPEAYCFEKDQRMEAPLCEGTITEIEELCLAANDIPSAEKRVRGYTPHVGETFPCDYYLQPGWYSTCGYVLSSQTEGCGTVFSWYRIDDLPDKGYGEVTVCLSGTSCAENKTITAARCQDKSYIFKLTSMDACPEAYCLEPPAKTLPESLLCNDTIHEIEELCLAANDIPSAEKRVSGNKPNVGETFPCDYYLRPGWYSTCGYVLSSQTEGCGTVFSWYRKDDLPDTGYGEVTVCLTGTSCAENKTITAARCQDGSYIFELTPMDACPEVYCLEPPAETPSESLLCNDTIHEIEELCLAANDIPSAEKRVSGYKPNVGETFPCDYYLRPGWYSTCGYVLSSQTEGCGTVFSWYRKDDLPVKGYGEVTVCLSGTSCAENKTITAARCQDGSYIFELSPMDACPEAYCLEPTVENPTENMLCKDTFRDGMEGDHCATDTDCHKSLECSKNLCSCSQGFSNVDGVCLQDGVIGGTCNHNNDCFDKFAECNDRKCTCESGLNWDGTICRTTKSSGNLGDVCLFSADCQGDAATCTGGTCLCKKQYSYVDGKCIKDGNVGGFCSLGGKCTDFNTLCVVEMETKCTDPKCKQHQRCRCITGFVYSDGECVKDAKASSHSQRNVVSVVVVIVACVLIVIIVIVLVCRKKVTRNLQTLEPYGTNCVKAKKYAVNTEEYCEDIRNPLPPYTESHLTSKTDKIL
ncbi:uncharacterized protein LOC128226726 isoform X2 [Mya arenaria]|nr:uncharacterized protein LOC128226726 isoform X2 [Mya arenaria]XP_052792685.1 uncharacterized protein LOC128226726 isoform X2 [Mya arenaria]